MVKAIIIGSGPAGLSAAYYGRLLDIKVELYESASFDENPLKPCGEAIPKFIFDYLPREMERDYILNYIKRAYFYFNGEMIREFKNMPLIDGYIIDKKKFLSNMAELAKSMGVKLIWSKFVHPNKVMDLMSEYDYVIDATGKGAFARRFLDYSNYKTIPVLQAYAKGNSVPEDTIVLWGVDKGYAWVFPRGDLYNIGVGGVYDNPNILRKIINEVLIHFNLKLVNDLRGASVSIGGPIKKLVYSNLRVIGEAAGMVMATTGEGIRFAVASGSIVFDDRYEERFWSEHGWKLRNSVKLLNLLLKIKNKTKLARIATDNDYFAFFEGLYSFSKILKIGFKYVFR